MVPSNRSRGLAQFHTWEVCRHCPREGDTHHSREIVFFLRFFHPRAGAVDGHLKPLFPMGIHRAETVAVGLPSLFFFIGTTGVNYLLDR